MKFTRILRSSPPMGGAQVVVLLAVLIPAKVIAIIFGSAMTPGASTAKVILHASLAVYACTSLSALSDHLYFGLLPTTLAAAGCFWCYRRIIIKENQAP